MCAVVMGLGSILHCNKILEICIQISCGVITYGLILIIAKDSTLFWLLDTVFGSLKRKLKRG